MADKPKKEQRVRRGTVEIRTLPDGKSQLFGMAAVFNSRSEDLFGFTESIAPGAFTNVLAEKPDVMGLRQHDPRLVLGRTLSRTMELKETNDGLQYTIEVPDTPLGQETITLVQRGDIDGSSFGFSIKRDEWTRDDEGDMEHRRILEIAQLFDVGPVVFPAYPDATVEARAVFASHIEASRAERGLEKMKRNNRRLRMLNLET